MNITSTGRRHKPPSHPLAIYKQCQIQILGVKTLTYLLQVILNMIFPTNCLAVTSKATSTNLQQKKKINKSHK